MTFLDTNSHLKTKPYNFDIKFQSNSESYERHGFWGPSLGGLQILYYQWEVFSSREYSAADWLVPLIWKLLLDWMFVNNHNLSTQEVKYTI